MRESYREGRANPKLFEAASMLAEELAAGMDEATVEKCRAAALERFELETERS